MEKNLPKDAEIAALLLAYTCEGDVTRILLTNGTELVYRRTMRSTLQSLARRRCKDVTLLRRWARRYTHRTLAHVNVAAVARSTFRRKADDADRVKRKRRMSVDGAEKPAIIALVGGSELPVLWSEKTTLAHIREARHICSELVREEEEAVLRRIKP